MRIIKMYQWGQMVRMGRSKPEATCPIWMKTCIALISLSSIISASCGAASCPIHYQPSPISGQWDLSLDYSYVAQNQLMSGSNVKDITTSTMHHTELETYTRTLTPRIAYQIDAQWGLSVSVPYIWRKHAHIHHHHGNTFHDEWEVSGIGDSWIDGTFTLLDGFGPKNRWIATIGVKLATGLPRMTNPDGNEAEIPIQPGSGSTDYRLGISTQFPIATLQNGDGLYTELPAKFFARYTLTGIGSDGWRAGDEIVTGARTDWALTQILHITGGVQWLYRMNAAAGSTGEDIAATGGQAIIGDIGVSIAVTPTMTWSISGGIPLYQTVNGEQLGIQSIAETNLSVRI